MFNDFNSTGTTLDTRIKYCGQRPILLQALWGIIVRQRDPFFCKLSHFGVFFPALFSHWLGRLLPCFFKEGTHQSGTMSTSSPFGRRKKSGSQTKVRIAVTGVRGVGKSAITVRFLTKRFIGEYGHDRETRYHHQCNIDGDIVVMEILDLGHEQVLTEDVVQWADGLLLVYSITDTASIEAVRQVRHALEESRNSKAVPVAFTVVANKADLLHLRKVDTMEGERLSKDMGCSFVELSASENYDKIAEVFHELYREIRMYKFGTRSTLFGRMFGHARDKKTMTL